MNFGIRYRQMEDGRHYINDYAFVEHAFRNLPVFKGHEAALALDLAFDVFYGLQRPEQIAQRPLLSIAVSHLEEYGTGGPLHKALHVYASSSVAEFFPSLGIQEFMDLPKETCNYILSISESMKIKRYQDQENAAKQAGLGPNGQIDLGKLTGKR